MKKLIFGILKVFFFMDPHPHLDQRPDPLVRGTDPKIRNWIRTKILDPEHRSKEFSKIQTGLNYI
jgi:hypothetical protein